MGSGRRLLVLRSLASRRTIRGEGFATQASVGRSGGVHRRLAHWPLDYRGLQGRVHSGSGKDGSSPALRSMRSYTCSDDDCSRGDVCVPACPGSRRLKLRPTPAKRRPLARLLQHSPSPVPSSTTKSTARVIMPAKIAVLVYSVCVRSIPPVGPGPVRPSDHLRPCCADGQRPRPPCSWGHLDELAQSVIQGAREGGAQVDVYQCVLRLQKR